MTDDQYEDFYEALGVDEDASSAEIRRAYIRLIKQVHPDVNPEEEELAKQVILAYEVLGDPDRREEYDSRFDDTVCPICGEECYDYDDLLDHMAECETEYEEEGCMVCGRGPTAFFSFSGNKSFVIFRSVYALEGSFCRSCAKGAYRAIQTRNLSWGWFGLISFFTTIGYGLQNLHNYYGGRRDLPEPVPSDPLAEKVLGGRPVILGVAMRLGSLAAVVGVIVLTVWLVVGGGGDTKASRPPATAKTSTTVGATSTNTRYSTTLPPLSDPRPATTIHSTTDQSYLRAFTDALSERNDVIELANERFEEWDGQNSATPPGEKYLVPIELADLVVKVEALPRPGNPELQKLHDDWLAALKQLSSAEEALAADFTERNLDESIWRWEIEHESLAPLLDFAKKHY